MCAEGTDCLETLQAAFTNELGDVAEDGSETLVRLLLDGFCLDDFPQQATLAELGLFGLSAPQADPEAQQTM